MICTGTDDDLEFYVRKCGDILGVTGKLDKEKRDAKHILEHIFFQVVEFKKLNQVRFLLKTFCFVFNYVILKKKKERRKVNLICWCLHFLSLGA